MREKIRQRSALNQIFEIKIFKITVINHKNNNGRHHYLTPPPHLKCQIFLKNTVTCAQTLFFHRKETSLY